MMRRALLTMLLACMIGGAAAQAPVRPIQFIVAGSFMSCPLGVSEQCASSLDAWQPNIGRSLRGLTSEGRDVRVTFVGFSDDRDTRDIFPVLRAPNGLHANERVLLVWDTEDDVALIRPIAYKPNAEQTSLVHALAVADYMQERWRTLHFGTGGWPTPNTLADPSDPANVSIRTVSFDDATFFIAATLPTYMSEEGRSEDYDFAMLRVVDRFTGESRALGGTLDEAFFVKVRNRVLVAASGPAGWEDSSNNLSEIAQLSSGAEYGNDKEAAAYSNKLRIVTNGWGATSGAFLIGEEDPAFSWPTHAEPNSPGATQ